MDRNTDAWQMPQGGVDPGESTHDAALRELEEETGVTSNLVTIEAQSAGLIPYDLPHELIPQLWNGKYRGQEQKWFLMRLFSKWKWMPKSALVDAIVPFKRAVYEQVLQELGDHL